ncbi:uncharacterized protein ACJ7VT_022716 [Polymixia lowei]
MRTLLTLLWVILGVLTPVRSKAVNAVTEGAKGEDDVLREAMTDGFIVEYSFSFSTTTESSKSNTSAELSDTQHPTPESGAGSPPTTSDGSDMIEGSGPVEGSADYSTLDELFSTPTPSPSSTAGVQKKDIFTEETTKSVTQSSAAPRPETTELILSLDSSRTTQSPSSASTVITNHSPTSESEDENMLGSGFSSPSSPSPSLSSTPVFSINHHSNTKQDAPESSTATSTSTAGEVDMEGSGSGTSDPFLEESTVAVRSIQFDNVSPVHEVRQLEVDSISTQVADDTQRRSGGTPGWMIILGFVVGVAVMVLICIAIATRDRWNGPNQVSKEEQPKKHSRSQQRELEMETFLQKERPVENGHAEEYTVIPLDELPEKQPLP